jgi:hypothetical protein
MEMAMTMGMAMGSEGSRIGGIANGAGSANFRRASKAANPLEGPRGRGPYGFREVRCGR